MLHPNQDATMAATEAQYKCIVFGQGVRPELNVPDINILSKAAHAVGN